MRFQPFYINFLKRKLFSFKKHYYINILKSLYFIFKKILYQIVDFFMKTVYTNLVLKFS